MKHARLSASSAHRWLRCPGSVGLGGENKSSVYAAEGTVAHTLAAGALGSSRRDLRGFINQRIMQEGFEITVGQEMLDAIAVYQDATAQDRRPDDTCWVEMPLIDALQRIDQDLGGTADFVRYREADKSLHVFDFKYGSGQYVEVDSNEQMMIYALGAMLTVSKPVDKVTITVVQPRFSGADPIRHYEFEAFDLLEFSARIKDAAEASRKRSAPLATGDHCQFCPARRICPLLEKANTEIVAAQFGEVYDPKSLSVALKNIPLVKARIKAIEEFAYTEAAKGNVIPGFKMVDKKPMRRWKNTGDVIEWAQENAVDPFAEREILSPTQLEKRIAESAPRGKKKAVKDVLGPFVESVSSGAVLVPEEDSRPVRVGLGADAFDILTLE